MEEGLLLGLEGGEGGRSRGGARGRGRLAHRRGRGQEREEEDNWVGPSLRRSVIG